MTDTTNTTNSIDSIDNTATLADITDQTLADDGPDDIPGAGDATSDDPATLRAQIADLNTRLDQEHEAFLRARADFANYKRRTDEEREKLRGIVGENILSGLLPVVDNFERALQAAQTTQDFDKLVGGVGATLRQLQDYLKREGIEVIKAEPGDPFDPNFHNAVLRDETTEYPENTLVEELQKGYTIAGRVLRPAMVKVATGAE